GVLAALAGVRAAADAVHRDRERLVRFARERAERHRARREALDDLRCGLDVFDRDRLLRAERQQAAQRRTACRLRVTAAANSEYTGRPPPRTACCSRAIVSGFQPWCSPSRRQA